MPTIKHGGGKVMVWGTMARSGVGSLTVVDGRLNAEAYIELVKKYVKYVKYVRPPPNIWIHAEGYSGSYHTNSNASV